MEGKEWRRRFFRKTRQERDTGRSKARHERVTKILRMTAQPARPIPLHRSVQTKSIRDPSVAHQTRIPNPTFRAVGLEFSPVLTTPASSTPDGLNPSSAVVLTISGVLLRCWQTIDLFFLLLFAPAWLLSGTIAPGDALNGPAVSKPRCVPRGTIHEPSLDRLRIAALE